LEKGGVGEPRRGRCHSGNGEVRRGYTGGKGKIGGRIAATQHRKRAKMGRDSIPIRNWGRTKTRIGCVILLKEKGGGAGRNALDPFLRTTRDDGEK